MRSYSGVSPYLEDGGDGGMWLEQEKLPPFLPADFHISITIHPDSGEEKERGRERGGGGGGGGESLLNIESPLNISLSHVIQLPLQCKSQWFWDKGGTTL